MSDKKEKQKQFGKKFNFAKILFAIFLGIVFFVLITLCAGLGYAYYYQDKVYPGVTVANYDLGGKSIIEAQELIDAKINNLNDVGISLESQDADKKYDVTYSDLGIFFDKDKTLINAYNYGRDESSTYERYKDIFSALFNNKNIDISLSYDESLFKSQMLKLLSNELQKPENAKFELSDNKVKIVDEKVGYTINLPLLKENIYKHVNGGDLNNYVQIVLEPQDPEITKADLLKDLDPYESIINKKINLTKDNLVFTPSKEDIGSWLEIKKGKNGITIDYLDNKIKDYVKYVSESSDTFTIDRKVDQNKVVLSEGQDGYELDRDKTFSEIKKALESNKNEETIILSYKNVPRKEVVVQSYDVNKGTLGLYPGKYIEVNLSQQIMYLIEGNNQIGSYTVSTGAWDTPTPIGTRTISSKDAMAWSSKYGLYMPYWNDIGGGYGIHELPEWPGGYKEGEAHLGIPVSHGCIRLGVGSAEFVYNWAPIGTPVVIHN